MDYIWQCYDSFDSCSVTKIVVMMTKIYSGNIFVSGNYDYTKFPSTTCN